MKIFRIAKDKNCPETLQITAFSGHFLYRCQHGEDALPPGVLHRLCRSAAGSSRSGGGHGLGHPVHRAGKGRSKVGLPLSGQLDGLRAGLEGAPLRPGQEIAQPAEDGGHGQLGGGIGAPVAPVRAPAYKAVHRDERPLPRVAGQGGGVVAGAAAQLVQDALGPACIKGIVPM